MIPARLLPSPPRLNLWKSVFSACKTAERGNLSRSGFSREKPPWPIKNQMRPKPGRPQMPWLPHSPVGILDLCLFPPLPSGGSPNGHWLTSRTSQPTSRLAWQYSSMNARRHSLLAIVHIVGSPSSPVTIGALDKHVMRQSLPQRAYSVNRHWGSYGTKR